MTTGTCENDIAELAMWIEGTYKGSSDLIGLIATDKARSEAAVMILGRYKTTSPKFVDPREKSDTVRLSAVRDALCCISRSERYAAKVSSHLDQTHRRHSSLSSLVGATV